VLRVHQLYLLGKTNKELRTCVAAFLKDKINTVADAGDVILEAVTTVVQTRSAALQESIIAAGALSWQLKVLPAWGCFTPAEDFGLIAERVEDIPYFPIKLAEWLCMKGLRVPFKLIKAAAWRSVAGKAMKAHVQ
jgi:hypothetical protein